MAVKKPLKIGGILLILLAVLIFWFTRSGDKESPRQTQDVTAEEKERKIKYWVAPMDPTYIRDKPGKSPMGMDLVPVYEDKEEKTDRGTIRIDPVTVQNMGVRTTKAFRGSLSAEIRTVGHVTYDEKNVEHVHTKISGWVEDLFVDTMGEEVHKGQKLLTIYSPELVATQEEYLQALKYREKTAGSRFEDVVKGADTLLASTRQRLLLMDIDPDQIEAIERRAEVQKTMLLRSHASGIVIKKHVLDGMKVNPGMELYTIADLSRVWVLASVYEYEVPFLKVGQEAEMSLPYDPGAKHKGNITFIYPYLSARTRTVQVRMEFKNPDLKLKPDMYADVMIKTKMSDDAILVPSESVIRTGSRNVVITALGNGKFLPKDVTLGPEGGEFVQIISGLDEGETVVTSGQFLIDSESNLKEAINKMLEAKKTKPHDMKKVHENDLDMNETQKDMMAEIIDSYMKMHSVLISDSISGVEEQARIIAEVIRKMKATDPEGGLNQITGPIEDSLEGLLSGELEKARISYALLSRAVIKYVKGPGKEGALSEGIKLFFCPMKEEYWLQKSPEIQNPYFGTEMPMCGVEEKY